MSESYSIVEDTEMTEAEKALLEDYDNMDSPCCGQGCGENCVA